MSSSGDASANSSASMSSMPGSVSIKTGCGRGEAGGVGSGTGYTLGSAHLVCNSLAQFPELVRPAEAEDPLDHPTSPVEQHGVGQAPIVIDLLHAAASHPAGERRPVGAHERQRGPCDHVG